MHQLDTDGFDIVDASELEKSQKLLERSQKQATNASRSVTGSRAFESMKIKVTTGDERDEDADSDNQPLNDISPLNGSKRPGSNYIGSNIESRQTEGFGYN